MPVDVVPAELPEASVGCVASVFQWPTSRSRGSSAGSDVVLPMVCLRAVPYTPVPRDELISKTSNKFWEIALAGSAFETRYGRRGTPGRVSKKKFASAAQAQGAYDRIVAAKVREGYVLMSPAGRRGKATRAQPANQPARGASLAPAVTKQLRRLGATVEGTPVEPVPVEQFMRLMIGVRGGRNAQRERFEKKIKDWRKVIDAMRVWEKQNPLPADTWHTGQPGARDPY